MAMELILLSDVEGLGEQGEVVKVAEGYARNFLLPRKLAAPVTAAAKKRIEKLRREREERERATLATLRELAQRIEQTSVSIAAKVGEGEKLFGSVTSGDIAEALKLQGLEVDRRKIDLAEPLRELGVFTVTIKLHRQVEAPLKVWVVEE
jgi:large subunit ribosomal protein L9